MISFNVFHHYSFLLIFIMENFKSRKNTQKQEEECNELQCFHHPVFASSLPPTSLHLLQDYFKAKLRYHIINLSSPTTILSLPLLSQSHSLIPPLLHLRAFAPCKTKQGTLNIESVYWTSADWSPYHENFQSVRRDKTRNPSSAYQTLMKITWGDVKMQKLLKYVGGCGEFCSSNKNCKAVGLSGLTLSSQILNCKTKEKKTGCCVRQRWWITRLKNWILNSLPQLPRLTFTIFQCENNTETQKKFYKFREEKAQLPVSTRKSI